MLILSQMALTHACQQNVCCLTWQRGHSVCARPRWLASPGVPRPGCLPSTMSTRASCQGSSQRSKSQRSQRPSQLRRATVTTQDDPIDLEDDDNDDDVEDDQEGE